MTIDKDGVNVYVENVLRSQDGKHEYPVDFVRELFINSDKNVEDLAVQLNLPLSVVEQHAKRGLQSWYQMKHVKFAERMRYFMDVNVDNLMETHSVLEDGHFLQLVQLKGMQLFLKNYYAARGHLFRVNEDGEISLDGYGLPIPLPLPNGPKDLLALEGLLKLKEGTKAAMNQIYQATQDAQKTDVVDVDSYGLFEKE